MKTLFDFFLSGFMNTLLKTESSVLIIYLFIYLFIDIVIPAFAMTVA